MSVFLESLLEPNNPSRYNQTRLNELKSYLNNIHYEVFIYPLEKHAKYEKQLNRGLLEAGIKPGLLFPLTSSRIILFSEENKGEVSRHKTYLMQQAEKGEPVIIVGAIPADEKFDWIQAANFSLVGWPADSPKPLSQMLNEQLDLSSLETTVTTMTAANDDFKLASTVDFFPSKRIAKRDFPFFCEKEIKELIASIHVLRNEIANLTQMSMKLETEQLVLQRQMLAAERVQIHLLKEMTIHYPLLVAEMAMTVAVLLCHAPEVLTAFGKLYRNSRDRLYKFYDRYSNQYASDAKHATEINGSSVHATSIRTTNVLPDASTSTESGIGLSVSNDSENRCTKQDFSKAGNSAKESSTFFIENKPNKETDSLLNKPESNGLAYCRKGYLK
jgi:hypothetical protein